MKKNGFLFFAGVFLILLSGCSTTQSPSDHQANPVAEDVWEAEWDEMDAEDALVGVPDPFEGFNRTVFGFNDTVYTYVFSPFSEGYKKVMPKFAREGVTHFFHNLRFPIRFTNQLLQGKPKNSLRETGKFFVNSTSGILGLIKRSDEYPSISPPAEDFGQTLAHWGFGSGPYLVLPFLGPITARDGVGRVGDYFLDPVNYAPEWEIEWGATILENVNAVPARVDIYNAITDSAIDKYTAVKDAYIQAREKAISE